MIACITLNQDSFGSELFSLNLGGLCYPNPVDIASMIATVRKRKPSIVLVDTASLSPEMANEHFRALREVPDIEFKLYATSGHDPGLSWVTFLPKLSDLQKIA